MQIIIMGGRLEPGTVEASYAKNARLNASRRTITTLSSCHFNQGFKDSRILARPRKLGPTVKQPVQNW